jgi:hypothetical protein
MSENKSSTGTSANKEEVDGVNKDYPDASSTSGDGLSSTGLDDLLDHLALEEECDDFDEGRPNQVGPRK